MVLNVPLFRQEKGSVECGLVCVQMLLAYYNDYTDLEALKSNIPLTGGGTWAPQLGSYLLNRGFAVAIVSLHPGLFTLNDRGMSVRQVLQRFEKLERAETSGAKRATLQQFLTFFELGGRVYPRIPGPKDVKKEIESKRPMLATLTSHFLLGREPLFNFHFNVVTGINTRHLYVNDPHWNCRGGKHHYPIRDFFFGVYASAFGDLDNASLIMVRPPK